jgi:fructose-bisphosphate aldolase class I
MNKGELESIAQALVQKGKGILAADESYGTIKKRFDRIDVPSTEETRRSYRNMLFTTPEAENFISGVILFDETIRQAADDGAPFPLFLSEKGVLPGIKVDKGKIDLPAFPGETITEGLDGLLDRLGRNSPSGGPSLPSEKAFRRTTPSRPTPRRWRATQP